MVSDESINYNNDWIINTGCSNLMNGDKENLLNISKYKRKRVIVMANKSKLPLTHVGKTMMMPRLNSKQVELENLFYVLGMKKNLISMSQLINILKKSDCV